MRDALSPPHTATSIAGGRAGSLVIRVGELSLNPKNGNTQENRAAPNKGNKMESTLLVQVWVSHPPSYVFPLPTCLVPVWEGESCPTHTSCPLISGTGRRAGSVFNKLENPTLLVQVWLSKPRSFKHGRAVPISYLMDQLYICPGPDPRL